MSATVERFVLDLVTPFGVARAGGYTGTKEQYEAMLAGLPTDAAHAAASAADALAAKQDALDAKDAAAAAQLAAESAASTALQCATLAASAKLVAENAAIAATHGIDENSDTWLVQFKQSIATLVLKMLPQGEGVGY